MYVLGRLRFRVPYFGFHKSMLCASYSGCIMQCTTSRNPIYLMTSDILAVPLYIWALVSFSFQVVLVAIIESLVEQPPTLFRIMEFDVHVT